VQSYTRRQLKKDRFVEFTAQKVDWTVEHRKSIITLLVIAAVVVVAILAGGWYMNTQEEKASTALGDAVHTMSAPIVAAGAPPIPNEKTYASATERAKAAHSAFLKVADDYGRTRNGKYARYMAGVTAVEMGDKAMAERLLKEAGDVSDDSIASLSKMALANLYRDMDKDADAVRYYKEVIAANSVTVPKATAQIAMAEMFENSQPAEAIKIYQQLKQDEESARKADQAEAAKKSGSKGLGAAPVPDQQTPLEQMAGNKITQLQAQQTKK
jgi:tetratricopeptide (TPR) repeat protein